MSSELKTEDKQEPKLSESFHINPFGAEQVSKSKETKKESTEQFVQKGSNRRLDEPWNVHFTVGSAFFANLIEFINDISYDVVLWFRKREMRLLVIDSGSTHGATVRFERTEFADYIVKGLENDLDEKLVYIDLSIILEELNINENFPIDFYIDTLDKNRFYVVCGKEIVHQQLGVDAQGTESVFQRYKNFDASVEKLTGDSSYQKMIINMPAMGNILKSLSKKVSKKKDISTIASMFLRRNVVDIRVENEVKGSSTELSGEDMMVSPQNEDKNDFDLKLFVKIGKVKLTFNPSMYIRGNYPIVIENRFGGGRIICYYLIAPRTEVKE